MQQAELFPVPNPCVGICQSNSKGYCMGCLRSRTERQRWKDLMPAEKMRVVELCDLRKSKLAEMLQAKKEKEDLIARGIEPAEAPVSKPVASKVVLVDLDTDTPNESLDLF